MMKKIFCFLFMTMSYFTVWAQVSFGQSENVNKGWKFTLSDPDGAQSVNYNDRDWQDLNLPHDWSVKEKLSPTLASATGYLPGGIGWYRKELNIPADKQGEKIFLYFEGVYNRSEVYLNGHLLGKRPNGYISFMYDMTPHIKYGQKNVVAVRVDHSRSVDSRWYTGSGIYRDVWIVYAAPVHIAQWGVYVYPKNVTERQATLHVEVELENEMTSSVDLTVENTLVNSDGKSIISNQNKLVVEADNCKKIVTELKVRNPKLWDLETPDLYRLITVVSQNGKVIDRTETATGIRSFTFDPYKGFALNNRWMKIKGVCLHHDAGVLGAAVPREVWKRRLETLKTLGCNAIRTTHNPQAPDLYELCDDLGILVMNEAFDEWEFAKRKWIEGWNVGTPGFQGTFDFFAEWGEKDLADMVRRDRNHVSVFAWSIGNEVDYPNDPYSHPILNGQKSGGFTQPIFGGYKKDAPDAMRLGMIAKRLVKVVKEYDQSRPVTAGLAGVAMSNETEYPGALDITGYNYTEGNYDSDHKKYPNRIIFGSENRHDLDAWKAVRDKEYIFGQFLWTGIDYLGESGRWPSRGFYSGLLDFGGFIKPRGYYRQSLWTETPMVYLGTYPTPMKGSENQMKDVWSMLEVENYGSDYEEKTPSMDAWPIWNYEYKQSIRVVCYTNQPEARLELNGVVVGVDKIYDEKTGIVYWDIPYNDGKLEVVALDRRGIETARYSIQSSGRPYSLSIQSVEKVIDKGGLSQVVLQVVDEKGIPVMLADNEVSCHIAGPVRLLGMEGSNNTDMSDYTDNRHRVYHGRLLIYLQAMEKEGIAHIRFASPLLKAAETILEIK